MVHGGVRWLMLAAVSLVLMFLGRITAPIMCGRREVQPGAGDASHYVISAAIPQSKDEDQCEIGESIYKNTVKMFMNTMKMLMKI